jgi:hypothetical protein
MRTVLTIVLFEIVLAGLQPEEVGWVANGRDVHGRVMSPRRRLRGKT